MRMLLGAGLVLALACGATAADEKKIDAKKLVGKWESVADKDKKQPAMTIEFTADGKFTAVVGPEFKIEGTYKVDGNKLLLTAKDKEKEKEITVIVTKLTDDVMEGSSDKGDMRIFKRLKK